MWSRLLSVKARVLVLHTENNWNYAVCMTNVKSNLNDYELQSYLIYLKDYEAKSI